MAKSQTIVSKITAARAKELYGNLAQSNYYQVHFGGLKTNLIKHLQNITFNNQLGFNVNNFITQDLGLLCSEANLPASSYATSEVKDNYMGISQEFAHTRLYTDVDFSFYVDNNYNTLRFFEGWMDYISGGNSPGSSTKRKEPAAGSDPRTNIYRRFNYPDDYKVNSMYITKFNRDAQFAATSSVLVYTFINAFPKSITSIPVSYGPAETLKVSITFNYDRYLVAKEFVKGTEEENSVLESGLISDKIVELQNNPNYQGPGSFILDENGNAIGVTE